MISKRTIKTIYTGTKPTILTFKLLFCYKILDPSTEKPPELSELSRRNATKDKQERVTENITTSSGDNQNGSLLVTERGNEGSAEINDQNTVLKQDVENGIF